MPQKINRKKLVEIMHESNRELFEEILQLKVEKNEFKPGISPIEINGYSVVLGLTEEINGTIIINFSDEVAKIITEKMNGFNINDMDNPEEKDELVEATIGEIINMIGGKAITKFQEFDIFSNITPPTIFYGEKMKFISKSQIVYCLSYKFAKYEIFVYVSIKSNSKLL